MKAVLSDTFRHDKLLIYRPKLISIPLGPNVTGSLPSGRALTSTWRWSYPD